MKKKNKFRIAAAALALVMTLAALASCAKSAADESEFYSTASYNSLAPAATPYPAPEDYAFAYDGEREMAQYYDQDGKYIDATQVAGAASLSDEKMIYTVFVSIQTKGFDDSVSKIRELVKRYGGMIDSEQVDGEQLLEYDYSPARYAYFTLRIPAGSLEEAKDAFKEAGNIVNKSQTAQNATDTYTHFEGQLKMYRAQEDALIALMEKADNVSQMIEIETKLAEVRYNIEFVTGQLKDIDNKVAYSTVNITLAEVKEYTKPVDTITFWQRIKDAVKTGLTSIGSFFVGALFVVLTLLPWLITAAVVIVVVVLIVKSRKKKKAKKAAAEKE
ncbi:MAG: DUF4349 domain-containing protein [Oscillospiraceae bacterium]|jgi:hypothetical protein|nr:DUF4349 domain-containing protein [Oscillospiraceae bacterium]